MVVVQDHQEILAQSPGMVKPFERHPRRHGPVADDTDDLVFLAQLFPRLDHAEGGRHPGASMPGVERIVVALFPLAEPAQSTILPESMKLLPPTGQQLVGIALVAGVPDNLVRRCIQQVMQGDGQLYHTKVRRQMPTDRGDRTDDLFTNLLRQRRKPLRGHTF